MTIDQAIKINTEFLEPLEHTKDTDTYKAIKLSIEALKRLKGVRSVITVPYTALLPGETKD